jgi:hypothetical protein
METLKRESAPFIQTYADYFRLLKKPSDRGSGHFIYRRPYMFFKRHLYSRGMSQTLISLLKDYGVTPENWSAVSIHNCMVFDERECSFRNDVVTVPSRLRRSSVVVYLSVDVQTLNSDLVRNGLQPIEISGDPSHKVCDDYVIVKAPAPYVFTDVQRSHSVRDCLIVDIDSVPTNKNLQANQVQ